MFISLKNEDLTNEYLLDIVSELNLAINDYRKQAHCIEAELDHDRIEELQDFLRYVVVHGSFYLGIVMENEDLTKEFLVDTTRELEPSLEKYRSQVKLLEDDLDLDKIEELKEYWGHTMAVEDEYDFVLRMTYSEKLLLSLWTKIERLSQLRTRAAREHMRFFSLTSKPKSGSKTK